MNPKIEYDMFLLFLYFRRHGKITSSRTYFNSILQFHKFFTRYMIEFNPWNWLLNVAFNVYIIWIDNWPLDQALDQSGHLEFDHLTRNAYTEMIFILNKSVEILILWTLCILLGNKIWNGVIGGKDGTKLHSGRGQLCIRNNEKNLFRDNLDFP